MPDQWHQRLTADAHAAAPVLVQGSAPADVMQASVSAILGSSLLKQRGLKVWSCLMVLQVDSQQSQSKSPLVRQLSGRLSHLNKECLQILGCGPYFKALSGHYTKEFSLLRGASHSRVPLGLVMIVLRYPETTHVSSMLFLPHQPMAQGREL